MSDSEVAMARMMKGKYRHGFLGKAIDLIRPNTDTILDLGCGPGAVISLLREKAPLSKIVGLDLSKYMLSEVHSSHEDSLVSTIQGVIPKFPLKRGIFDAVIAVQSMSEVHEFIGLEGLIEALSSIRDILRDSGMFILLDHQSPGEKIVDVKTTEKTIEKLEYFKEAFVPRKIKYKILDDNIIQLSLRDLYDFITKTWAFDTALEDEEMNESHTLFTCEEYVHMIEDSGMKICNQQSVVDISTYMKRNKIKCISKVDLPDRYVLISAKLH